MWTLKGALSLIISLAVLLSLRYHVDSLLTMYDLYRHLGENQFAEVRSACLIVQAKASTCVARAIVW